MPVIDAHAHIYPSKIAAKAVRAVSDFYTMAESETGMRGDGTPEGLLQVTKGSPITHFIVHSVATTARSVTSINDFLAQQQRLHPEFIAFGTMHQDFPNKEAEVERALAMGLHGFKLHPDTQRVNMDDPRLMEFYEIIAGRVPVVIHCGDYRFGYSTPERLKHVLRSFPNLVVDAAHFAGWSIFDRAFDSLHEDDARDLARSERLFVDSSSTVAWTGSRHLAELVNLWGVDHVMFGSDFPMWDPVEELQNEILGQPEGTFTSDELDKLLYKNAMRFCGMRQG
jgi:predicted TIM-barrel fold metal-dependent hydrolase